VKLTGRTLTLRGTTEQFLANTDWYSENILDYANVLDINKAWRLRWFEVWPVNSLSLAFAGSGYELALESILSTELPTVVQNRADDNRLIAWSNQTYTMGGKSAGANSQGIIGHQVVVDPDHIIQKELNISFRMLGGSVFENSNVEANYIVYLEEVEITPTESIISTIKQSAQSLNQ
jgi:hypothetical protein